MATSFDPGYITEPFLTLCSSYPDSAVYGADDFRLEWGPVFHRGRLDGSARILVIGQDPAQHESIARRCLVGEAGRRIQGFLSKLGIDSSYAIVNAFLYSVYGNIKSKYKTDANVLAYRNKWLDALATSPRLEAVVALGDLADGAWQSWKTTPTGQGVNVSFAKIHHPTYPESSSQGDATKLAKAMKEMLQGWNAALQQFSGAVQHPDAARPLVLYGDAFKDGERVPIPALDLPAGSPAWMGKEDGWAKRVGETPEKKRANITVTVPSSFLP